MRITRQSLLVTLLLTLAGISCATAELPEAAPALFPDGRDLLAETIRLESLAERERQDWVSEKAYLQKLVESARNRRLDLEDRIAEYTSLVNRLEAAHSRNLQQKEDARAFAMYLARVLPAWQSRLATLVDQAPRAMKARLGQELQLLRESSRNSGFDPAHIAYQFRKLLGILQELNTFQGTVTPATELWQQPDGQQVLAKVIYFGLGHFCYLIEETGECGFQHYSQGQWSRFPDQASAKEIEKAWQALDSGDREGVYQLPVSFPLP